jgi:hypothetical protein
MIDETLQQNMSVHSKNRSESFLSNLLKRYKTTSYVVISTENRNIDQALLSLVLNTNTTVSLADPSCEFILLSIIFMSMLNNFL